jgi:hypothetical protein
LEGRKEKRRGAKHLQKSIFVPPKLRGFGGEGRYAINYFITLTKLP